MNFRVESLEYEVYWNKKFIPLYLYNVFKCEIMLLHFDQQGAVWYNLLQ